MDQFSVKPLDDFCPSYAIEHMLQLVLVVFDEVYENRERLIFSPQMAQADPSIIDSLLPALEIARADTIELISLHRTVDFSLNEKEYFRLSGPILHFRMMAIKVAREKAVACLNEANDWLGYSLHTRHMLDLAASPIRILTRAVDGPRGAVEFSDTLHTLMEMKSLSAA